MLGRSPGSANLRFIRLGEFNLAVLRPTAKLTTRRPGFLLPMRVLSRLFRLFLEALRRAFRFAQCLAPLRQRESVFHAKPPIGGPQQVLEYLDPYTHRVARRL